MEGRMLRKKNKNEFVLRNDCTEFVLCMSEDIILRDEVLLLTSSNKKRIVRKKNTTTMQWGITYITLQNNVTK